MILKIAILFALFEGLLADEQIKNDRTNLPFGWRLVKINRRLVDSTISRPKKEGEVPLFTNQNLSQDYSTNEKVMDTEIEFDENDKSDEKLINQALPQTYTKADFVIPNVSSNVFESQKIKTVHSNSTSSEIIHINNYKQVKLANDILNKHLSDVHIQQDNVNKYVLPTTKAISNFLLNGIDTNTNDIIGKQQILNENTKENFQPNHHIDFTKVKVAQKKERDDVEIQKDILNKYFLPIINVVSNFSSNGVETNTNNIIREQQILDGNIKENIHLDLSNGNKNYIKQNHHIDFTNVKVDQKKEYNNVEVQKDILNKYFLPTIKVTSNFSSNGVETNTNNFIREQQILGGNIKENFHLHLSNDNKNHIKQNHHIDFTKVKVAQKKERDDVEIQKDILNKYFLPTIKVASNFPSNGVETNTNNFIREQQILDGNIKENFHLDLSNDNKNYIKQNHHIDFTKVKVTQKKERDDVDIQKDILNKYLLSTTKVVSNFSSNGVETNTNNIIREQQILDGNIKENFHLDLSSDNNNYIKQNQYIDFTKVKVAQKKERDDVEIEKDILNKYFLPTIKVVSNFSSNGVETNTNNIITEQQILDENRKENVHLYLSNDNKNYIKQNQQIDFTKVKVDQKKERNDAEIQKDILNKYFLPTIKVASNFSTNGVETNTNNIIREQQILDRNIKENFHLDLSNDNKNYIKQNQQYDFTKVKVAQKKERDDVEIQRDILNKYFLPTIKVVSNFSSIGKETNTNNIIKEQQILDGNIKENFHLDLNNDNKNYIKQNQHIDFTKVKVAQKKEPDDAEIQKDIITEYFLPTIKVVSNFSSNGVETNTNNFIREQQILDGNTKENFHLDLSNDNKNYLKQNQQIDFTKVNVDQKKERNDAEIQKDILNKYFLPTTKIVSNFSSNGVETNTNNIIREQQILNGNIKENFHLDLSYDNKNYIKQNQNIDFSKVKVTQKKERDDVEIQKDILNKYFLPTIKDVSNFSSNSVETNTNNIIREEQILDGNIKENFHLDLSDDNKNYIKQNQHMDFTKVKVAQNKELVRKVACKFHPQRRFLHHPFHHLQTTRIYPDFGDMSPSALFHSIRNRVFRKQI